MPSYMLWTSENGLTDRKLVVIHRVIPCSSSQPNLVHRSCRPFPRQKAPARDCVPVTWLFNAQFANPSSSCTSKVVPAQDECRGLLYPCWHVSFNIIMRPASFTLLFMYVGIIYSLTSAGQHSGTQEACRRVCSACHVQLSNLSCLRTLSLALHSETYNHNDLM
jgi:hypothetical protein